MAEYGLTLLQLSTSEALVLFSAISLVFPVVGDGAAELLLFLGIEESFFRGFIPATLSGLFSAASCICKADVM